MIKIFNRDNKTEVNTRSSLTKRREFTLTNNVLILEKEDLYVEPFAGIIRGFCVDLVLVPEEFEGTDRYEQVEEDIKGLLSRSLNPEIKFY